MVIAQETKVQRKHINIELAFDDPRRLAIQGLFNIGNLISTTGFGANEEGEESKPGRILNIMQISVIGFSDDILTAGNPNVARRQILTDRNGRDMSLSSIIENWSDTLQRIGQQINIEVIEDERSYLYNITVNFCKFQFSRHENL